MTVGIYKAREEAEAVAVQLRSSGVSAEVLATREIDAEGSTRTWHVIVPREETAFLTNVKLPPSAR